MTQAILFASNWLQEAIEGLVDWVKEVKRNRARKAAIQLTKKELSKLSNYELKDIGIGRSDITSIANETFYDARDTHVNKNLKGWV
mgnify:FL=1|jgi:uncharacterized protein YjiS (DUF1127 family)|tara:strand:+ start:193 stop:450 length:258 start_codon:yes stop_codon:yes gene_type:complete